MQAVMVYRVNSERKTKNAIGVVDTADAVHIFIDISQARQAYSPGQTRSSTVG